MSPAVRLELTNETPRDKRMRENRRERNNNVALFKEVNNGAEWQKNAKWLHREGNPVISGKSNKSYLAADRVGLKGGVRAGRTESVRETIDSVLCSVPAAARTRPPRLAPTTRRRLADSRRLPTLGARQHSPHSPTAPDPTDMEVRYYTRSNKIY